MYLRIIFLGIVLIVLCFGQVKSQDFIPYRSVYVELGGAGLPYSFNYDFRFDKKDIHSWGMRVGAGGYAFFEGDKFFSLPVLVNKLYGPGPGYFEMGAGLTLVAFSSSKPNSRSDFTQFVLPFEGSPNMMGVMSFGYKHLPKQGGFTWRTNLNPVFNTKGFWPLWIGIGIGYAFQ